MKELICIICPKGCKLSVDETHDFAVTGATCRRGEVYGREEMENPQRTLTTTVIFQGGVLPRLPVKTDRPIAKALLHPAMAAAAQVVATAPIKVGTILLENICGSGANLVATRDL